MVATPCSGHTWNTLQFHRVSRKMTNTMPAICIHQLCYISASYSCTGKQISIVSISKHHVITNNTLYYWWQWIAYLNVSVIQFMSQPTEVFKLPFLWHISPNFTFYNSFKQIDTVRICIFVIYSVTKNLSNSDMVGSLIHNGKQVSVTWL